MKCAYCHKEIESGDYLTEGHLVFCNGLCRYSWRKQKGSKSSKTRDQPISFNQRTSEVEATIEAPGLEGRNLSVFSHFWKGPQLYLDGIKQIPFKKGRFIGARFYKVESNGGQELVIKMVTKTWDPVPKVYIDGEKYRAFPGLKWYEYVWICIPLLLMYLGGALGGIIGGLATLTNSRYFRSTRATWQKYVLAGLTSAVSIYFFFQISGWVRYEIYRYSENQSLQTQINSTAYTTLNSSAKILASHPWVITNVTDLDGHVLNDKLPLFLGAIRFFDPDGHCIQLNKTGEHYNGVWELDPASQRLFITMGGEKVSLQIHRLTDSKLTLASGGTLFVHKADD